METADLDLLRSVLNSIGHMASVADGILSKYEGKPAVEEPAKPDIEPETPRAAHLGASDYPTAS